MHGPKAVASASVSVTAPFAASLDALLLSLLLCSCCLVPRSFSLSLILPRLLCLLWFVDVKFHSQLSFNISWSLIHHETQRPPPTLEPVATQGLKGTQETKSDQESEGEKEKERESERGRKKQRGQATKRQRRIEFCASLCPAWEGRSISREVEEPLITRSLLLLQQGHPSCPTSLSTTLIVSFLLSLSLLFNRLSIAANSLSPLCSLCYKDIEDWI